MNRTTNGEMPSAGSADFDTLQQALADLRSGSLGMRLAGDAAEIEAAQALRYRVFYDEMAAHADAETARLRRDVDPFDTVCDHLLVVDHDRGSGPEAIIATYRLLRGSVAELHGGFYTAGEYDIDCLYGYPGEMLELGRSCVDAGYRGRPTMQLLWRGIAQYVFAHDISLMFGCGSMHGTDPAELALPLSYLHHFHMAPEGLRPRALDEHYVDMNFMEAGAVDEKRALAALPPLIKGYLRLGGMVGDGAVVDGQFNTTDVCVVVKTDQVTEKYFRHYGRSAPDEWAASHGRGEPQ